MSGLNFKVKFKPDFSPGFDNIFGNIFDLDEGDSLPTENLIFKMLAGSMVDSVGLSALVDSSGNGNDIRVSGFTANWSGAEYLTASHITGSETVVEQGVNDTSIVTFASGVINFTAGTCSYLKISNGDELIIESSPTSAQMTVWDRVNGNEYTVKGAATPFFTVEKSGSQLLGFGYTEDATDNVEIVSDMLIFPSGTGITPSAEVLSFEDVAYIGSSIIYSMLEKNTKYRVKVTITNYIKGLVWVYAGDEHVQANMDGVFYADLDSGAANYMLIRAMAGVGTTLDVHVSFQRVLEGFVPSSAIDGAVDIFGNSLTRESGYIIGDYLLLYAPETQSFYDMAVAAGVSGDLYSSEVVSIGTSPDDWFNLGVNGIAADMLFMSNGYWAAYSQALTEPDITKVEKYIGIEGPYTLTPTSFADTNYTKDQGDYIETNPFARTVIKTESEELTINFYSNLYSSYPTYCDLGVVIDGYYSHSIFPTADGVGSETISLGPGAKTVEIVNSSQSKSSLLFNKFGTFVTSIEGDKKISQTTPSSGNGLIVYGDSISVGFQSVTPSHYAWTMWLRGTVNYPLSSEGWAGRSLKNDAETTEQVNTLVAKFATLSPSAIWLAIGTNDYLSSGWSASAFGVAYANLIDAIHLALPDAVIYCQSPIVSPDETANSLGDTLPDYRTQVETAANARPSYCTYVDGSEILTMDDMYQSGIHPSTYGNLKYYKYVKTVLGIL
jgi:lysophospholipase L1-like esterase